MARAAVNAQGDSDLTIGILITWFGDMYSTPVISGVADVMREHGVNVICFAGGRPNTPLSHEFGGGILYDLVGPECVDGLVLMSGTLSHFLGQESFEAFAERFAMLPRVSVGVAAPGCSSVLVDNGKGLRDLIVHLIETHSYRRIGFICGPPASKEAASRLHLYRSIMEEYGLPIDPNWIAPGSFDTISGHRAIDLLFAERKVSLDAIVVANDQMALAAIEALQARGIRVPENVAVVGFDDAEVSNYVMPSLTTVRQPLYKLGKRAAVNLLALLAGEEVPEAVILQSEAVIRESCGCSPRMVPVRKSELPLRSSASGDSDLATLLAPSRERIVAEMVGALDPSQGTAGPPERVLAAFIHDLGEPKGDRFLSTLEDILRPLSMDDVDVWPWQKIIAILRRRILPWIVDDRAATSRAENLWQQAAVLIGDGARRVEAHKRIMAERRSRVLSSISQALISTINLQELADAIGEGLPRLQVSNCWLSLYDDPSAPASWSHLLLSSDKNGRVKLEPTKLRFASKTLVPEGMFPHGRQFTIVAKPLYAKSDQLGFVLLEVGLREGTFYDDLTQELSSAVMRVRRETELERLHVAQFERSRELEEAYRGLKENQEKLLISEKMAALGRLTAGMAHEMNTPLAAARMALEELDKLTKEYTSALGDPAITPADHREIAKEMNASIRLAANASEQVAGFVHGIKSQTRDLSSKDFRRFNAVAVIADTVLLLNHALRKAGCSVSLEHGSGFIEVYGSPGRLAQVVSNLVTNAIDASRPKGGGLIRLSLSEREEEVELTVTDSGTGIPADIVKRIFDPMFTTKPFGEGTGLGLSIVHDIVSSDFNGTIEVDTEVGRGTKFTLRFKESEGDRA